MWTNNASVTKRLSFVGLVQDHCGVQRLHTLPVWLDRLCRQVGRGQNSSGRSHCQFCAPGPATDPLRLNSPVARLPASAFSPSNSLPYDVRFEQIKQAPLLVLDDLRAQATSTWAEEKLFQLVDYRYLTRRPTVLTISSPDREMKELATAAPRIASRLADNDLCRLCFVPGSGRPRSRQRELDG